MGCWKEGGAQCLPLPEIEARFRIWVNCSNGRWGVRGPPFSLPRPPPLTRADQVLWGSHGVLGAPTLLRAAILVWVPLAHEAGVGITALTQVLILDGDKALPATADPHLGLAQAQGKVPVQAQGKIPAQAQGKVPVQAQGKVPVQAQDKGAGRAHREALPPGGRPLELALLEEEGRRQCGGRDTLPLQVGGLVGREEWEGATFRIRAGTNYGSRGIRGGRGWGAVIAAAVEGTGKLLGEAQGG